MSKQSSRTAKKTVISIILSFILMLCIIAISAMSMGKYSMFSIRGVMHCCDRIEYYESINTEMTTIAGEKGIPYGLKFYEESSVETETTTTEEVSDEVEDKYVDIFSNDKIRTDIEGVLTAQVEGEVYEINTDDIRANIIANATVDFGELTEAQQKSLDAYINEIEEMYKDKMIIKGSDYFVPLINIFTKIITVGIPVGVFIAILCIFFLISIRSVVYRGLRYVAYSILAAGIVLATVFSASISDGFIYKFNISDVYMRKFYTYWIGHEMLMQVFVGIGCVLAGIILIYIISRQKNERR